MSTPLLPLRSLAQTQIITLIAEPILLQSLLMFTIGYT